MRWSEHWSSDHKLLNAWPICLSNNLRQVLNLVPFYLFFRGMDSCYLSSTVCLSSLHFLFLPFILGSSSTVLPSSLSLLYCCIQFIFRRRVHRSFWLVGFSTLVCSITIWILFVLGRLLIFDISVWVSHLEKFMIWLTLLLCRRPSLHIHLQLFN